MGIPETRKDDITTKILKDLIVLVKNRRERVLKALSKERIDGEFQPFMMIEQIPKIEEVLWNYKNNTRVYGLNALRNRFQYLMTLGAVMRSDSLYSDDMCDLCDFTFLQPKEGDPYHIMILRDGDAKTSKGKVQYGKVMRHKLPELCSICALGLYLLVRFEITQEVNKFDFIDNNSWFNQKLMISPLAKKKQEWSKFTKFEFLCDLLYDELIHL